ncbi:MAG TPA: universal stress protein [Nitrososphaeraceae archaeon]|nr:universal stress protein [Nitrososphaeraceae archaeon]
MYPKILVPVDGSEISYRALNAALFFSEKLGSEITVIHVMEDIPITHIESQKLLNDMLEISVACKQQGQDILSKCSETAKNKGLMVNTILLKGNPASKVLDFCKNGKYDVIILGSRGRGKIKEIILGSVSSKILHNSSCPVLLIK